VSAAVAGHDEAFVELCQRTSGRAFGAIYRITKNRIDAKDVFQESILIALLHLNQFKLDSSFSTWFTRIGIDCALMLRRRRCTSPENPGTHPIMHEKKLLKAKVATPPREKGVNTKSPSHPHLFSFISCEPLLKISAARSPMTVHGAMVLPVVTRGMIEPSAMRSFWMP
jgi:DNA-directed RNA polymerase specialized sigma24 family protein